jgi:exonuclease I
MMDNIWMWMENNADVKSLSMDSMRDLFGMSKENAHDALQDVKDTANLMIGFMKLYRRMAPKVKFEKAFADGKIHI